MEFLRFYSIALVLACEELRIFSEPVFLAERGFGVQLGKCYKARLNRQGQEVNLNPGTSLPRTTLLTSSLMDAGCYVFSSHTCHNQGEMESTLA